MRKETVIIKKRGMQARARLQLGWEIERSWIHFLLWNRNSCQWESLSPERRCCCCFSNEKVQLGLNFIMEGFRVYSGMLHIDRAAGGSKFSRGDIIQKHQFFSTQPSLWSNSHIHTWLLEKPTLTIWIFVSKVMSLYLNMLYLKKGHL